MNREFCLLNGIGISFRFVEYVFRCFHPAINLMRVGPIENLSLGDPNHFPITFVGGW